MRKWLNKCERTLQKFEHWCAKYRRVLVWMLAIIVTIGLVVLGVCNQQIFSSNNSRGEYIKVLLTAIGGILVLGGLWLNARRTKAIEKQNDAYKEQNDAYREQNKNFQQQNEIAQHGNVDNRFKNAVEHLGSDKEAIVLGGAYELYRIADEEESYRKTVFDILCSYLRQKTTPREGRHAEKVTVVTQTILDLLFKSPNGDDEKYIFKDLQADLTGCCLRGAQLEKAILEKAILVAVDFKGTLFICSHLEGANLTAANLETTQLYQAHIEKARLDSTKLSGTNLTGAYLHNVNFTGAIIDEITTCFDNAEMDETTLFSAEQLQLETVQRALAQQKARDEKEAAENKT